MAESESKTRSTGPRRSSRLKSKEDESEPLKTSHEKPEPLECAVCLQQCIYPARLPCSHIFCYLCLKGIAYQSRRCAICRTDISLDYLDNPDLLESPTTSDENKKKDGVIQNEYRWFYEGRNGWWRYDDDTNEILEEAKNRFDDGTASGSLELLICGNLYIIDFEQSTQYNKGQPWKRRKIKRDCDDGVQVKGVAGIRSTRCTPSQQ